MKIKNISFMVTIMLINMDSHASHDDSNHNHTSQIIPKNGYSCRLNVHGQQIPKNPYGPIQKPKPQRRRPGYLLATEYLPDLKSITPQENPFGVIKPYLDQQEINKVNASLDEYLQRFAASR